MNLAELAPAVIHSQITLPLYLHSSSAGFGSPVAEDEPGIDLNEHLIRRPATTFYARVQGDSLRDKGIFDGDLLMVDRSLHPGHGDLVVAVVDGELLCRELDLRNSLLLCADADSTAADSPAVSLADCPDLRIEGVVISAIKEFR